MNKGPNQLIEDIRTYIGKNELNEAIQSLKLLINEFLKDGNFLNTIASIENENARLHSNQIKGLLTIEQYNIIHNRIIHSLLSTLEQVKKAIAEMSKYEKYEKNNLEPRNEDWRKLSKDKQIDLAHKGNIQIKDPVYDFQLYFYNKFGELFKKHSLVGQLQYIDLQKAIAKKELHHDRKLHLYSIVCALYEELEKAIEEYLKFKDKEDSFWKKVSEIFRNDLIGYSYEDKIKVTRLKNESHEFYNNISNELIKFEDERRKNRGFKQTLLKIQHEVVQEKKELENLIVAIPGEYANWFSNGYLWYCNGFTLNYTDWLEEKGKWIEYSTPVLSQYGKRIFSPFSGLIIKMGSIVGDNPLWYMIPEKGTNLNDFNPSFVYGELIDYIHQELKLKGKFAKYAQTNLDELIKKFEEEQLKILEIDEETSELLIAAGIKKKIL